MDRSVWVNRSVAMSGAGGYDGKMSQVEDYLHDYRKVLEQVRSSRQGCPISEVRQALREGFESKGIEGNRSMG